jgi:peptide deformylase
VSDAVREDEPGLEAEAQEPLSSELTEEERERRQRALELIRQFGDPVLKSRASDVTDFGPELAGEAERMIDIMHDAIGVGLAATQLGVMRRMLVFQAGLEATPTVVVNPIVEWRSEEQAIATEGCLSLPGVAVDVERALYARVRAQRTGGESFLIEASGLEARVLQHEIDHLDGVLMIDRTERQQRRGALRALREGGTYSPPTDDSLESGDELSATTSD